MCPISGCISPWTGIPRCITPPPIPVPTVTYARLSRVWPPPHRSSASAAPLTSVSRPIGLCSSLLSIPRMFVFCHSAFGVVVMYPYRGESCRNSIGPNVLKPNAVSRPPVHLCVTKVIEHSCDRRFWVNGLNACVIQDLAPRVANRTQEFCTSSLDRPIPIHYHRFDADTVGSTLLASRNACNRLFTAFGLSQGAQCPASLTTSSDACGNNEANSREHSGGATASCFPTTIKASQATCRNDGRTSLRKTRTASWLRSVSSPSLAIS